MQWQERASEPANREQCTCGSSCKAGTYTYAALIHVFVYA